MAVSFKEGFWALLFPVLLVVTIRVGLFTPSEAGAFAVVYAIGIGMFVYRELDGAKSGTRCETLLKTTPSSC